MANLTNVTNEPLEVRAGVNRVIEPGQTVDVSDYLLVDHAWPAATWRIDGTDVVQLVGDAYIAAPPPDPNAAAEPAPKPAKPEGE